MIAMATKATTTAEGEACDHPHHHAHDDDVKSFAFKSDRAFNPAKLEDFLGRHRPGLRPQDAALQGRAVHEGQRQEGDLPGRAPDDGQRTWARNGRRARRRAARWCSSASICPRKSCSRAWKAASFRHLSCHLPCHPGEILSWNAAHPGYNRPAFLQGQDPAVLRTAFTVARCGYNSLPSDPREETDRDQDIRPRQLAPSTATPAPARRRNRAQGACQARHQGFLSRGRQHRREHLPQEAFSQRPTTEPMNAAKSPPSTRSWPLPGRPRRARI
jgi:hypothetical protein